MRRLVALALVLFATPFTTRGAADTIWQKAAKPPPAGLLTNDEVHRQVALAYHRARETKTNNPIFGAQSIMAYDGALNLLVRHGAAKSSDPRLRYDLGLILAKLNRHEAATAALEGAYALAKDHPLAEDGLFELAISYSKLGKHAEEEGAYLRALDATDRQSHKAIIHSNLAESRMAQGKLESGIDAVETAILLEPDMASGRYNLAILKDRSGDAAGALESAKHALELDPEAEYLDGEGVFFEPAYEKHWYYALRNQALSERELGEGRGALLMSALVEYRLWLDQSDPNDRYRKRCEENIARLEKQLKLKKK